MVDASLEFWLISGEYTVDQLKSSLTFVIASLKLHSAQLCTEK